VPWEEMLLPYFFLTRLYSKSYRLCPIRLNRWSIGTNFIRFPSLFDMYADILRFGLQSKILLRAVWFAWKQLLFFICMQTYFGLITMIYHIYQTNWEAHIQINYLVTAKSCLIKNNPDYMIRNTLYCLFVLLKCKCLYWYETAKFIKMFEVPNLYKID
jgi:hypothetical protein